MYKFVKVKCNHYKITYDNWFLLLESPILSTDQLVQFNGNMIQTVFHNMLHGDTSQVERLGRNFQHVLNTHVNYNELLEKYQMPLLIREIGSYMLLGKEHEITDVFCSDNCDWPLNSGEIVICENDLAAPLHWINYLTERFPTTPITIINNFRNRDKDTVKKLIQTAKIVTFTTTFSNLDWWETVCDSILPHHKVIGQCFDNDAWNNATQNLKFNIERV
jgi:hypothetical protein